MRVRGHQIIQFLVIFKRRVTMLRTRWPVIADMRISAGENAAMSFLYSLNYNPHVKKISAKKSPEK